jgi:broad specificity phosphatase PhoE
LATLLIARHGETQFNVDGRFQGRLDVPLSDNGRRQAQMLADYLAGDSGPVGPAGFSRIISSPQARAMDTARAVADACGMEIHTDDRLMEIDVGRLAGLSGREARAREPKFFADWARDCASARYPDGESVEDVSIRAVSFFDDISSRLDDADTVLVVAHAVVLKCMLVVLLGSHVRNYTRIALANASLSRIRIAEGGPCVDLINDTHYLEPSRPA